jgi:hypothetical protein
MAYEDLDDKSVGAAGSDTFDVIIPDLDPSSAYPIQFRWQFADQTYGPWSVSKTLNTPEIARPESTNIVASWNGTNLEISWDAPNLANGFAIYLTSGATTVPFSYTLDKTKTAQKAIISAQSLMNSFASILPTTLTGLLKTTYIDTSTTGSAFAIAPYVDGINGLTIADTDWLITSVDNGYMVTWTKPAYPTYLDTLVYESSTISGTYLGVGSGIESVTILQPNTKYVKIRHRSITGAYSNYSNAKEAKAYDPIIFDNTPPNNVTGVSAAWSNDDIIVSYTMPASDPGARFEIVLTSNSVSQTFFKWPSAQTGAGSVKITDNELFSQFGQRYTSYTGVIKSIDGAENSTSGVSFSVAEKTNPLANILPTFTVTQISNGYTVLYTLPTGAIYAKVYQGSTSGFTPNDSTNLVYSGISPAVIINTTYSEVFIKIRYFGIAGNGSLNSAAQPVTPLEAGMLSLINNEVKISTTGSILAGDSAISGGRAILNKTGLYVYNTGGTPTTQIIANATDGSPTLITTNAKIANWMVYSSKIENTLDAGTTQYTGLSPNGTYAFWAGSTVAGGNSSANFSVTPAGAVIARNISVFGGTFSVGSNFGVNSSGVLTATNADITGTIKASAGKFTGTVDIGTSTDTSGQLRIQGTGGKIEMGQGLSFNGTGSVGIQGTASNGSTVNFYLRASDGYLFSQYGSIGNWTIGPNSLTSGAGSSAVGVSSGGSYAFYAGNATPASAPFYVTSSGALKATNVDLTGSIKATSGKIGSETTGWNINVSNGNIESYGTPDGTNKAILNSLTGEISGAKLSGVNIVGGQFTLQGSETNNKWNVNGFRAGGSTTFIETTVSGYGSATLYASDTSSTEADLDSSTASSYLTLNIPSQVKVTPTAVQIYGLPGVGNGLTASGNLVNQYTGTGVADEETTQYRSAYGGNVYVTSGNLPSYNYGKAARYRMIVADPYDNNMLKRGLGIYYGTLTNAPGASAGFVGDLWISW